MYFDQPQQNPMSLGGLAGLQGVFNPQYNQLQPQMTLDAPMPQMMPSSMAAQSSQVQAPIQQDSVTAQNSMQEPQTMMDSYLKSNPQMRKRISDIRGSIFANQAYRYGGEPEDLSSMDYPSIQAASQILRGRGRQEPAQNNSLDPAMARLGSIRGLTIGR